MIRNETDPQNVHQGHGISGRFQQLKGSQNTQQHSNMEFRPSQNSHIITQQHRDSKNRGRSDEINCKLESLTQQQNQDDNNGLLGPSENGYAKLAKFDGSSADETPAESPNEQCPQDGEYPSGQRQYFDPSGLSPDYHDDKLGEMAYQDLKKETWETESHGRQHMQPDGQKRVVEPLKDRFEMCIKEEDRNIQFDFLKQLSMAEWEEIGDLFIERFGEIMKKMRMARQNKRNLVSDFENRIEGREALVRRKSENLEVKFRDMKKGGEGVLRGKIS
jgi:hypothetical protein